MKSISKEYLDEFFHFYHSFGLTLTMVSFSNNYDFGLRGLLRNHPLEFLVSLAQRSGIKPLGVVGKPLCLAFSVGLL